MKTTYKPKWKTKKAFTLVELSLAIGIISILLILMTTLILALISIYRKGNTINSINSVGRSIIEDFQNSVTKATTGQGANRLCGVKYTDKESIPYENCVNDNAKKLIYNEFTDSDNKPRYGVFCTGSYSYLWNTGYVFKEPTVVGSISFNGGNPDIRLLKVYDPNRTVCGRLVDDNYHAVATNNENIDLVLPTGHEAVDLIAESDTNLAIYHLYVADPAVNSNTSNALYSGSFILATQEGGVSIMTNGDYCKAPGETDLARSSDEENFDYCAINKFNFAVQGNGG